MNKDKEIKMQNADENTSETVAENSKVENFIKKNKVQVIVGALIVVAVIVVAVFWFGNSDDKENEASLLLSRSMLIYDSGDYEKALAGDKSIKVRGESVLGLKYIADKFSGTESGKLAAMYAGKCLVELDKAKEAEEYFEIAAASEAFAVKQGSFTGMAVVAENEKEFGKAAELYEQAAGYAVEKEVKAKLLLFSALNYSEAKNSEKAIANFKQVVGLSQFSEFGDVAKYNLTKLGIEID